MTIRQVANTRAPRRKLPARRHASERRPPLSIVPSGGVTANASERTVRDLLDHWIAEGARAWKPSYLETVRADCRNHFASAFGERPLSDLGPLEIHEWLTGLDDAGLAPQTVLRLYRELHAAFAAGVRLGLLPVNPVSRVRPPRVARREASFLEPAAALALLEASRGTRLYALIYLALESGARKGELLALRWSDVDLGRRELRIRRTAREFSGRGVQYSAPKTHRSARAVSLSEEAVRVLREQQRALVCEAELAGPKWSEHDLVFPSSVGTPQLVSNLRRSFQATASRAGLNALKFHSLRHTSASLMADSGVPVATISAQLGHAKPSITQDIYTHVLPRRQDEAAAAVAARLAG